MNSSFYYEWCMTNSQWRNWKDSWFKWHERTFLGKLKTISIQKWCSIAKASPILQKPRRKRAKNKIKIELIFVCFKLIMKSENLFSFFAFKSLVAKITYCEWFVTKTSKLRHRKKFYLQIELYLLSLSLPDET